VQPTGFSAAPTVPEFLSAATALGLAESARWRAPDTTAMLADHAVRFALANGDLRLALRAEGWLAHGMVTLGYGWSAAPRAAAALAEADNRGDAEAGDRLRVELATLARRSAAPECARQLLDRVLERSGLTPVLRADASLEASLAADRDEGETTALLAEAGSAFEEIGGEAGLLGQAHLDAMIARRHRERGELAEAVERARSGLHRALGDRPANGRLEPSSPRLAILLCGELCVALADSGRTEPIREISRPMLRWSIGPATLEPAAVLRLVLASRVYWPAGEQRAALEAATWVAGAVDCRDLPELEAEAQGLLAEIHEARGELNDALAESRRSHLALRVHAQRGEHVRAMLAEVIDTARRSGPAVRPGRPGRPPIGGPRPIGAPVRAQAPRGTPEPAVRLPGLPGRGAPVPGGRGGPPRAPGPVAPPPGMAGPGRPSAATDAPVPGPRERAASFGGFPEVIATDGSAGAGGGVRHDDDGPEVEHGPAGGTLASAGEGGTEIGDRPAGSYPDGGDGSFSAWDGTVAMTAVAGDLTSWAQDAPDWSSFGRDDEDTPAGDAHDEAHRAGDRRDEAGLGAGGGILTGAGQAVEGGSDRSADPLTAPDPFGGPEPRSVGVDDPGDWPGSDDWPAGDQPGAADWPGAGGFPGHDDRPSGGDHPGGRPGSGERGGDRSSAPDVPGGIGNRDERPGDTDWRTAPAFAGTGEGSVEADWRWDLGGPASGEQPSELGTRPPDTPAEARYATRPEHPAGAADDQQVLGPGGFGAMVSERQPSGAPGPEAGRGDPGSFGPRGTGAGAEADGAEAPDVMWLDAAPAVEQPPAPAGPHWITAEELGERLTELAEHAETRPAHLVVVDLATPTGGAAEELGTAAATVADRVARSVQEQVPAGGHVYVVEPGTVTVALVERDAQAVSRWVRSASGTLTRRWAELSRGVPRAMFRVAVRPLDPGWSMLEHVYEVQKRLHGPGAAARMRRADAAGDGTGHGRHGDAVPGATFTARPGSGGRRRRPDPEGPDGSGPGGAVAGLGADAVPTGAFRALIETSSGSRTNGVAHAGAVGSPPADVERYAAPLPSGAWQRGSGGGPGSAPDRFPGVSPTGDGAFADGLAAARNGMVRNGSSLGGLDDGLSGAHGGTAGGLSRDSSAGGRQAGGSGATAPRIPADAGLGGAVADRHSGGSGVNGAAVGAQGVPNAADLPATSADAAAGGTSSPDAGGATSAGAGGDLTGGGGAPAGTGASVAAAGGPGGGEPGGGVAGTDGAGAPTGAEGAASGSGDASVETWQGRPVSELSFAELIDGALAAYREA
jgi:hypothetical protein